MPSTDEEVLVEALRAVVNRWLAENGGVGDARAPLPAPDVIAALRAMGYLEPGTPDPDATPIPGTEAISFTDPFLCEELASALRATFHQRFLHYRYRNLTLDETPPIS